MIHLKLHSFAPPDSETAASLGKRPPSMELVVWLLCHWQYG